MRLLKLNFIFENINSYRVYLTLILIMAFGLFVSFSIFEHMKFSLINISLENEKTLINNMRSNIQNFIKNMPREEATKQKILDIINEIEIKDSIIFVTDSNLKILSKIDDKNAKFLLQNNLNKLRKIQNEILITTANESIILSSIEGFDWYLGVRLDTQKIIEQNILPLQKNGIRFLAFFIGILFFVNLCYELLNRRYKREKMEYEKMLGYRSKMIEMGQNFGAMSHQLKQPINSLSLLISSTFFHLNNNILEREILEKNLELSQKALNLANKTIDTFTRFYRYSEQPEIFDIKDCLEDVLSILSVSFNRHNILVDGSGINSFSIKSIETFIYQILLVLLQNAMEALVEISAESHMESRKITIKTRTDSTHLYIEVSDNGSGIKDEIYHNLFSKIITSKRNTGTGFGLFFARKIARENLGGDLVVLSQKNPTTMSLSIRK